VDGIKANFSTLLSHRKKQFLEHHLSPEKKKNQIFKKPVIIANEPTCDDNPLLEFEVFQEDPIDLSLRPQEIDRYINICLFRY